MLTSRLPGKLKMQIAINLTSQLNFDRLKAYKISLKLFQLPFQKFLFYSFHKLLSL